MTADATQMKTLIIPFSKLFAWDNNARKTAANKQADAELQASIAAHGLLQPPIVIESASRGAGHYEVVAGERRRLALLGLAEAGSLSENTGIECLVAEETDPARLLEISLAENTVREPMHPADQFKAFTMLVDNGTPVADIAARFGVAETTVQKRLRLARVSPKIIAIYRAGEISLEQVQAFTVTDDHKAQEKIWKELSDWRRDPEYIRQALTEKEVAGDDKRVRFVTLQAYEAAGGTVRRDLFSDGEDGVFIDDVKLLDRLVKEKLEQAAAQVTAEGWQWAEIHEEFGYQARSKFQQKRPDQVKLSKEDEKELKALSKKYDAAEEKYNDAIHNSEEENRLEKEMEELQARMEAIQEKEKFWPETIKAKAGAILTLESDGRLDIERGFVRPKDAAAEEKEEKAAGKTKGDKKKKSNGSASAAGGEKEEESSKLSSSVVEDLTGQKSAAISAVLALKPDIALAEAVYTLGLEVFFHGDADSNFNINIDVEVPDGLPANVTQKGASKGVAAMAKIGETWEKHVPSDAEKFWEWCHEQEQKTLLEILAYCMAASWNCIERYDTGEAPDKDAHENRLAKKLGVDMPSWFTPTADNFYNRVSKPVIFAALKEGKGGPVAPGREKLKKGDLASLAERELQGTGWIPVPCRVPGMPFKNEAKAEAPAGDKKPTKGEAAAQKSQKQAARVREKIAQPARKTKKKAA